jgi:WS/DGAT/MGAT family acyltransferase
MTGDAMHFERSMTDAEALMWHVERDPWMSPSGGSLTLFDRPLDAIRFRRAMVDAVAAVPRLRQRVVEPATPLGTPHWETDPELDLDWHVRHAGAPGDGGLDALLTWMTTFLQDPYDRTRPLWQYVVIDNLPDGLGALAVKIHHVVTDGKGAVRLGMHYTSLERDAAGPTDTDLEAVIAHDVATERRTTGAARDLVGDALRLPKTAGRSLVDALAHPERLLGTRKDVEGLARTATDQLRPAGASLWTHRSRRRAMAAFSIPFAEGRAAAKSLGGSLNDLFLTGVVEAAARYHEALHAPLERVHATFVVSTRTDASGDTNAFTPVPVDLPVVTGGLQERFTAVQQALALRRADVSGEGPFAAVAPLANVLPTGVVTSIARSQAAHIDVATSNLPGYLGDSYIAGAKTLHTYVFGPVAGTACNVTLYTTAGSIDVGVHLDPAAITDADRWQQCLAASFHDLVACA